MAFSINSLRSKIVGIFLVILLVILLTVGVFWLMSLSSDEEPVTLRFVPKFGEDSLIRINITDRHSLERATKKIDQLLAPYSYQKNVYKGCDFNNPPPAGRSCEVDLRTFGPCTKGNNFGYRRGTPCVFLKLSTNPSWVPEFYNESTLPESMPLDLKDEINYAIKRDRRTSKVVWVTCEGRDSISADDIGQIEFLSHRGFPGYFFPCTNDEGCTPPLVAVHFKHPRTRTLIKVQCKVWAYNLQESVNFELFIE